jgi:hypothetical protein
MHEISGLIFTYASARWVAEDKTLIFVAVRSQAHCSRLVVDNARLLGEKRSREPSRGSLCYKDVQERYSEATT